MTPSPGDEEADRVYAVRLDPRARADIDAAHVHFVEISGDAVADEWQNGLFAALATLAQLPRRQPIAPENRHFRREVRQLVYRRRPGSVAYRVLFTINSEAADEAPSVYILHVRHGTARPMTQAEARRIEGGE
jgi:plasmid stabilization system protein ParE